MFLRLLFFCVFGAAIRSRPFGLGAPPRRETILAPMGLTVTFY